MPFTFKWKKLQEIVIYLKFLQQKHEEKNEISLFEGLSK